ncbi:hypothetical protein [Nocardia jiangsuensis]|uniref:RES domain-containing protein n=1 Tax=Nocardia jiangsuensis TaxID=1691563 RepID=A0ABV8DP84_9NOCA
MLIAELMAGSATSGSARRVATPARSSHRSWAGSLRSCCSACISTTRSPSRPGTTTAPAGEPESWGAALRDSGVPTGVAVFPSRKSVVRGIAEKQNTVVHWSEFDRGGLPAA